VKNILYWLEERFSMRRWEAISAVVMLCLILVVVAINYSLPYILKNDISADKQVQLSKIYNSLDSSYDEAHPSYDAKTVRDGSNLTPFNFDPNTITKEQWLALGLSERQVNTILKYRDAGGTFYDKADVKKMYSISEQEYLKLEPYINIAKQARPAYAKQEPAVVELNTCDTAALNKLPGIGSYTAHKLVVFRESVGGFVNLQQVLEAGVSADNFEMCKKYLRINTNAVKRINLNTITFQELKAHPYCNEAMALSICKHRKTQGGSIANVDEIATLPSVSPELWQKLKPYVVLK
jgi:competence protein ComEA